MSGRDGSDPAEHEADVNSVVFSPDGATLATACWDGTARLWNCLPVASFCAACTPAVQVAAFSPDGRFVASGGSDGLITVWNLTRGDEMARMRLSDESERLPSAQTAVRW
jgi:WD40 repeat protein